MLLPGLHCHHGPLLEGGGAELAGRRRRSIGLATVATASGSSRDERSTATIPAQTRAHTLFSGYGTSTISANFRIEIGPQQGIGKGGCPRSDAAIAVDQQGAAVIDHFILAANGVGWASPSLSVFLDGFSRPCPNPFPRAAPAGARTRRWAAARLGGDQLLRTIRCPPRGRGRRQREPRELIVLVLVHFGSAAASNVCAWGASAGQAGADA